MRVVVCAVVSVILAPTPTSAQEDEYEEWLEEQQAAYQQYLDEQDEAFLTYLKENEWVRVDVESPEASPIDDKPLTIPRADEPSPGIEDPIRIPAVEPVDADEEPTTEQDPSVRDDAAEQRPAEDAGEVDPDEAPDANDPADQEADTEDADPQEDPEAPDDPGIRPPTDPESPPESEASSATRRASTVLFGTSIEVPYAEGATPSVEGPPGKDAIGAFWQDVAETDLSATMEALETRKQRLALGDWGYYRALKEISREMYDPAAGQEQENAATLWIWSMMVQSGYAARVGYNDTEVFLMLPSNERLFDRPQLYVDDQRYYIFGVEPRSSFGSLKTYQGAHPDANRVLSFDLKTMPTLDGEVRERELSFDYDRQSYTVTVDVNPALLDFLEAYPDVELPVFFRAGMSPTARRSVVSELEPLVRDRSEVEALNLLLRFVQTAFEYEVDQENFGTERFLFAEETLGLRASDCEDRSVLFAYLVRQLLGLRTAALSYPRHVTTAVRLENSDLETVGGYQVEVQGETYVMADPTYINAGTGMAMPFVRDEKPEVISVQRPPE